MRNKHKRHAALILLLALVLPGTTVVTSSAQKTNKLEIEHWRDVLRAVKRELKQNYYDPTFHGIDIEARFNLADEKMKNAQYMVQLERIVSQVLLDLDDTRVCCLASSGADVEMDEPITRRTLGEGAEKVRLSVFAFFDANWEFEAQIIFGKTPLLNRFVIVAVPFLHAEINTAWRLFHDHAKSYLSFHQMQHNIDG